MGKFLYAVGTLGALAALAFSLVGAEDPKVNPVAGLGAAAAAFVILKAAEMTTTKL